MAKARFSHSMVDLIRSYSISGLTNNSDVARILSEHYGMDISAADVARWRREYPRLNAVIVNALDNLIADANSNVADAIRIDKDMTTTRWFLEKRSEPYTPKSKLQLQGNREGLAEVLARRQTEQDLYAKGVLYDEDGDDDERDEDDYAEDREGDEPDGEEERRRARKRRRDATGD